MRIEADSPEDYISKLPEDRQEAFGRLRQCINQNLPSGFTETMSYGMIGWVVPKSTYPAGYHADPSLPLPFINLGNQKHYLALYHSGLYTDPALHKWFAEEYAKAGVGKLDMGKSCVRFKKMDRIPYPLIGELCTKIGPKKWIAMYEARIHRR